MNNPHWPFTATVSVIPSLLCELWYYRLIVYIFMNVPVIMILASYPFYYACKTTGTVVTTKAIYVICWRYIVDFMYLYNFTWPWTKTEGRLFTLHKINQTGGCNFTRGRVRGNTNVKGTFSSLLCLLPFLNLWFKVFTLHPSEHRNEALYLLVDVTETLSFVVWCHGCAGYDASSFTESWNASQT